MIQFWCHITFQDCLWLCLWACKFWIIVINWLDQLGVANCWTKTVIFFNHMIHWDRLLCRTLRSTAFGSEYIIKKTLIPNFDSYLKFNGNLREKNRCKECELDTARSACRMLFDSTFTFCHHWKFYLAMLTIRFKSSVDTESSQG